MIEANVCPAFLLRDRVAGNGGKVNGEYGYGKSIIIQFVTVNNEGVTASEVSVMLF